MKEGKHARKEIRRVEGYSVLILIATLFMSIAYANISGVELKVEGEVATIVQQGVFITDVTDISENSENSTINNFIGTMLDSEIVLEDTTDPSVILQVTLYNNSDKEYTFIDVLTDKTDKTLYSNENISFDLDGLQEYVTTISPNSSLTFTITFKYIDETDISNNTLNSKLNFRFKESPKLVLSNDGENYTLDNIYPDYTPQEYEFTVSNYDKTGTTAVSMSYGFEIAIDSPLTAKIYDENNKEVTENITIGKDEQIDHTYILKIIWDDSKTTKYNDPQYANQAYTCSVNLKATPVDEDYLEYTIEKNFNVDINTAPLYFNATMGATDISISNNVASLEMTINNYDSNTKYNKVDTTYEISITDNDSFTFSSNNEGLANNVITRTIGGGSKVDDSFNIEFTADMSSIELTESLTLKIVIKSPYVTEIELEPININFHTVTVTLDATGGTVSPSTITVYQTKTYADLPTPTWTGHTFNGWYSATTGGTKYTTTTKVTSTASTQTLYAQWTSHLLADNVSVGDYVNYPVTYSNVNTSVDNGLAASYTGWRVLSIDGSGNDKYVRLVTAGIPMTYRHPYTTTDTTAGSTSATKLTTNFFSTEIASTVTDGKFYLCGFKNSSGGSITTIADLKTLFASNNYTQISNGTPKVQSITKADLDSVLGTTSQNLTDPRGNNLLAIPAATASGGYSYAGYYLATSSYSYYLWNVYYSGYVVYTYGHNGVRPVVTLKSSVETTGQTSSVWQLKE